MKKALALRLAAISGFVATSVSSAMAAVPGAVTTAIDDMAADGATIAGSILVAIIAVVAVKFLRKAF